MMKKTYEILVMVKGSKLPEEANDITSGFEKILRSFGTEIKETQDWGRRRLAYKIEGEQFGYYKLYFVDLEPKTLSQIKSELALLPRERSLMRYMFTQVDEQYIEDTKNFKGEIEVPAQLKELGQKFSFRRVKEEQSEDQQQASEEKQDAEVDEIVRGATKNI
jgi:small subunit ribosomal protein S6